MSRPFVPRPYQKLAIDFILETPRAALYAAIGLGKTVCALTAYDYLVTSGYETKPALVISTLRVARSVWPDEPLKWDELKHLRVSAIIGDPTTREAALKKRADIYTINFDNIPWLLETLKGRWDFGMVIVDESTRLKGVRCSIQTSKLGKQFLRKDGTKRARLLAEMAWEHREGRWLNLTGTPAPNGLKDLYGSTWFQDFGQRLGRSHDAFMQRWFEKGYDGFSIEPKECAAREINERVKDVCLSLLAEDWFDLIKPIETTIPVELGPHAKKLYKQMEKEFLIKFGKRTAEAVNAAVKNGKLMQLCNGAVYLDPEAENDNDRRAKEWREVDDAKLDALDSLIEEGAGNTLLVAYQFKSDLIRMKKAFPKGRAIETLKDENDFKAGKFATAFAHAASCGHGLDGFQYVCHRIAFFGNGWDAELRDQIIGRIGPVRQEQAGFKRPVYIYNIVAAGTIEEDILEMHIEKTSVQDAFLSAMRRLGMSA